MSLVPLCSLDELVRALSQIVPVEGAVLAAEHHFGLHPADRTNRLLIDPTDWFHPPSNAMPSSGMATAVPHVSARGSSKAATAAGATFESGVPGWAREMRHWPYHVRRQALLTMGPLILDLLAVTSDELGERIRVALGLTQEQIEERQADTRTGLQYLGSR
jgi:hypothetical protein